MIRLKNVALPEGGHQDISLDKAQAGLFIFDPQLKADSEIDASHLLKLPGLIDPHVHFRTPGQEYKENWESGSLAAILGGYTTVFDMPNTRPPSINVERLQAKKNLIEAQLANVHIPLRYQLYFGADKNHFDQLAALKPGEVVGIKVFMGSSTGELLMNDDSSLHAIFALAHHFDLLIAVHAEDEALIGEHQALFHDCKEHKIHSKIRSPEVAARAVKKAIDLARLYQVRLYILHVSSIPELALIHAAKEEGLSVYAETCPHYLFLTTEAYQHLEGRAQMNPALRNPVHQAALWEAVNSGLIDTIGSDHAPHTPDEKAQAYDCCPSGVPGIETTLPLLYTAHTEGRLSLNTLLSLTQVRPQQIFRVKPKQDFVLIDTKNLRPVKAEQFATRAKWSPYEGMALKGWPALVQFDLSN